MNIPSKLLVVATSLIIATLLFATANGRLAHATHAGAGLPTLRMNYFVGLSGKLAKTLDPALVTDAESQDVILMIQQNLVVIGTDDAVHLQLARRYTVSKDRKTYTFYIRPNARYSNGDYVTASDIKKSIDEALRPSTGSVVASQYLGQIAGTDKVAAGKATTVSGITVLGVRTISFRLTKPYAFFLKTLTYPTADALDQRIIRGKTRSPIRNFLTSNCPGNVGAGPFMFKCSGSGFHPSGQTPSYTLVPNPFYFGTKPKVQVVMPAINSYDTGYKTYEAGDIDMTTVPTPFLSGARKNREFVQSPMSEIDYAMIGVHLAPFNNVNCRLAVAYAIDRSTITNRVLHGADDPLYDIVPPGFLGYYNGANNPHYNLARAKAYVAKCPGRNDAITYTYPTTGSDADNRATAIVNMMQQAGLRNAKTKAISLNDWLGDLGTGYNGLAKTQTQMMFGEWVQDYPDPQDYVQRLLDCNTPYNAMGWCNKAFHSLVQRADTEANTSARSNEYIRAQHIALSSGVWLTMYNLVQHELFKPYVHGMVLTVAYQDPMPKNMDWSNVTISAH